MKALWLCASLVGLWLISLSAIAGGGIPSKRVSIYNRQLRRLGVSHNVDSMVVCTPEQAIEYLASGESCYIESVGDHEQRTQDLLFDLGLVDKQFDSAEWLKWVLAT